MNTIITNANIYTVDPQNPRASAMAIANDRILAVGNEDDIKNINLPDASHLNLNGGFVLPGLIDAHVHLQWTGLGLLEVDLFEVPSIQEAVYRVAVASEATPPGEWVTGRGWTHGVWKEERFPTAKELDPATSQHPVVLTAKSAHAIWVNSLALKICEINRDTPDPMGGHIVRDEQGEPTGVLLENAMYLVDNYMPAPTAARAEAGVIKAMRKMNRCGLTGVHCMDGAGGIQSFNTYQSLHRKGQLSVRIVKQLPVQDLDIVIGAGIHSGFGDNWLRVGGIKIFADGALGARTAAMLEPYEDEPRNRGIVTYEKEALCDAIQRCHSHGLATVIHSIGDRANRDVLDAIELIQNPTNGRAKMNGNGTNKYANIKLRNRVEHAQHLSPCDLPRFSKLDVIASVQPIHATQDMHVVDKYLGPERSKMSYATKSILDSGVRIAFGSDTPIETFDPIVGIHAAVTRRRADGSPSPDGWHSEQRVSVYDAIHAYTMGAAYAGGMDHIVGSIEPGKLADLTILSKDITKIHPDELLSVKVTRTMVNGEWV
jgi:hypothetical protein